MKYSFSEIVLLEFPFTDGKNSKLRPAVVLKDTEDSDIILARVTSQIKNSEFDIEVKDWKHAGLMLPSIIRIHKIATLESEMIVKSLGNLSNEDSTKLKQFLFKLFSIE